MWEVEIIITLSYLGFVDAMLDYSGYQVLED
jgi:hypothetical protein